MNKLIALLGAVLALAGSVGALADDGGHSGGRGLNEQARQELAQSGVNRYLGQFEAAARSDAGDGWTRHTYDNGLDVLFGEGPLCIAGTPYSIFTKAKNPKNLLIFLQGGGACWQDFYFCNILSEAQEPPPPPVGIWDDAPAPGSKKSANPLADYSVVYLPYCDGSVFTGDNDVVDPNFPFGPVRFHRGLQNASAGVSLAREMFPKARRIVVAGSSAGGVGAAGFTPFLARMAFGNRPQLSVFNDAGPVALDLNDVLGGIPRRAMDWDFGKFYPASCTDCSDMGQGTEIIKWRLANDNSIRESFYSTDGDGTNRGFLGIFSQEAYRQIIVTEHGLVNEQYPDRYKRFIRSGDTSHTALQTPLFEFGTANGVPLNEWTADFLRPGKRASRERGDDFSDDDSSDDDSDDDSSDDDSDSGQGAWVDIVEDFVPAPVSTP